MKRYDDTNNGYSTIQNDVGDRPSVTTKARPGQTCEAKYGYDKKREEWQALAISDDIAIDP